VSQQTPLHAAHERAGASFTDFAGFDMPLRYDSDLVEHKAVRTTAGMFDLSHMAEIAIQGPDAAAFLDYASVTASPRSRTTKPSIRSY